MSGFQKQKFYIIAHNPNTVSDVKKFLDAGANALEPDICVVQHKGSDPTFFVSHDHGASSNPFDAAHSLETWLSGVHALLTEKGKNRNLALIMFDFKDPGPNVDINKFLKIVHDKFGQFAICSGVAIGVTVGKIADMGFLTNYKQNFDNVAVGIDEEKDPLMVSLDFQEASHFRFSYANGIILTGIKEAVFDSMLRAREVQFQGNFIKLIYPWVLADADAMRDNLHIGVDGMIVNLGTVAQLKGILLEKDFVPLYELAQNGYNPWGAPPPPRYLAKLQTQDVDLAGTDAKIMFNLTGTGGTLSLLLNADYKDVLEQGQTDSIVFQGANIGTITKLHMTMLTSDINSDWLPAMITVTDNIGPGVAFFNFGEEEWLAKGAPLTKLAEALPAM